MQVLFSFIGGMTQRLGGCYRLIHMPLEDAELGNLSNYVNILTTIQGLLTGEIGDLRSKIVELNNINTTGFHTQEIASQNRVIFVLQDYLVPVKAELKLAAPILTAKQYIK